MPLRDVLLYCYKYGDEMKKIILSLILLITFSFSETALFAKIIGVKTDDILNIRNNPSYTSKKLGSLPPHAYIAIEKCQSKKNAIWCKIYQIPQQFYEDFHVGWVNARYLSFSNRGYVNIQDEKNDCYYAIGCEDDDCSVVKTFNYNYEQDILSNLVVERISRHKLKGTSHFGAMGDDGDGYCTSAIYIENYLKQ